MNKNDAVHEFMGYFKTWIGLWTMDRTLLPAVAYISLSWLSPSARTVLYVDHKRYTVLALFTVVPQKELDGRRYELQW